VKTDIWHVISNGRPVGRFPEYQLVEWVHAGQVNAHDLFWREGMAVPAPAHTLPPFAVYYPTAREDDEAALRWLLPVGRSGWAIAAGYLGLFSILLVFGPFAIAAGILAVRDLNQHPEKHGLGRAIFGIVAGALGTLVGLIVLLGR
jgi:hypothetical protein